MNPVILRIHEWSLENTRFRWQLDAIRRICEGGALTDEDLTELELIGLAANGIELPDGTQAPEPRVLDVTGEDEDTAGSDPITLAEISEVANVKRLAPDQSLSFAPTGLTVIYGDNGAGKSGYARILRNVCRARCPNRSILTDVYTKTPAGPPSAKIAYRVGCSDRSTKWVNESPAPVELANVSLFDTDCASVHVTAENDLAFTPHGLDVLPKLAALFLQLRDRFRARASEADKARPAALNDVNRFPDTQAARLLTELCHDTDIEKLRSFAHRNEVEETRQRELVELFGQDPVRQAGIWATRKGQIVQLKDICDRSLARTSDDTVDNLKQLWQAARSARQAANLAAGQLFTGETLPGVGGDAWRFLWESARRFSETNAYPGAVFPETGDAARCVLCLQPLQKAASDRMRRFEDYVKGTTQQEANAAEQSLRDALQPLARMAGGPKDTAGNRDALKQESEDLAARVRRMLILNRWRKRAILRNCSKDQWGEIPNAGANLHNDLQAVIDAVDIRIQEAVRASQSEERERLQRELLELRAREWLGTVLDDVQKEIEQLALLQRLNVCIRDVSTDAITRKNTELTDEFVTEAIKAAFADELKSIGLDYLGAVLVKVGGQYGTSRYQIQLAGTEQKAKLLDVLSEGEFRAIALAAFLAELATSETCSGLVFDDPVSSLDHKWRERFARRLVAEATNRQVVIFTHDLVFLMDVLDLANKQRVGCIAQCLQRAGDHTGRVSDGVPWGGMTVSKRIGALRQGWQRAEKIHRTIDERAYEPIARDIYGALRETWERAIEEVLFNDVVQRLRRGVETQRLRQLAGSITSDDCRIVDDNMTLCSRFLRGHDHAPAINEPVPPPDQLKGHIDALDDWIGTIRARRQGH